MTLRKAKDSGGRARFAMLRGRVDRDEHRLGPAHPFGTLWLARIRGDVWICAGYCRWKRQAGIARKRGPTAAPCGISLGFN